MHAPESNKITNALGLTFSRALTTILSDACTSSWRTAVADFPSPAPEDLSTVSRFRFTFSGSIQGEAFLLIRNEQLASLGFRDVDAAAATDEDHTAALQATLEAVAANLTKLFTDHGPATIAVESIDTLEIPQEHTLELRAEGDDMKTQVSFLFFFDQQLITSAGASSALVSLFPDISALAASNLDLVLDVELNVTLRFGQRQLSLREVLDLSSGSVVELDRQVDEPVELVLDGRVVARGEAVIIDGNYGMRITQMLHPVVV